MGIKDMAARAKEKLSGANSGIEQGIDPMADKFDNATGERFAQHTDRGQEALNERLDDFTGDEGPRHRDTSGT